ncbi:MAG: DPP IV N-terminal domain-containing protein [Bacteroidales bacterium]|nr:DPP IV N-terminal domain-containing protein [Bacteroidales bacterium]
MKRILFASLVLLLALPMQGQKALEGKRFTEVELLNAFPDGIVKPAPFPMGYSDANTLLYSVGRDLYAFSLKDGSRSTVPPKPRQKAANIENMVPGWVNPTWSPDSTRIAYTLGNDLYSIDVNTRAIVRHTYDGSDLILNGYASWVYYEEILGRPSQYRAFWWSPDSKVIAFYRFDNSKVPMFPIYSPKGKHGSLNQTRYPKTGDPNPEVKLGFVSALGGETVWADFDPKEDQYFGTPFWSGDGTKLMVSWMDRAQDNFRLFSVTPGTGAKVLVYKEHQDSWIDWMDDMLFEKEGIYIVRDFSGWQQIYFLSYDGSRFEQLTSGHNWGVHLLKVDKKYLFFTAKREATTRVDIYRLDLKDKVVHRISYGDLNFTGVQVSADDRNVCALASNYRTPTQLVNISVPASGKVDPAKDVRVVYDTKGERFNEYAIALPELVYVTTRAGVSLPAAVTWPVDFDPSKRYPVKVNIYGGPDNPQVREGWRGVSMGNQWWANHGVIQVTLDNRAGGHYGKKGVESVYRRLGVLELKDFCDGIDYFRKMPFVDENKIGVEGFSFGGTMTTLCVTEGNEHFQYGIAGGGVYDWGLYDTHYGERYMDRPQDNPDGYRESRVIDRVDAYKGDATNMLRITHGTGDDNVHFQNSLQLIDKLESGHKDFELMIYPDGMHGYRGDQGVHSSLQDYKFWYRYLLGQPLPDILFEYFKKK